MRHAPYGRFLQQTHGLIRGRIELAMHNASSRRHPLCIAGPEDRAVAEAIAMLQRARQHPDYDLHGAMRMCRKSGAGRHDVVIDHAQHRKPHRRRIVVFAERERVPAIEPSEAR